MVSRVYVARRIHIKQDFVMLVMELQKRIGEGVKIKFQVD